MSKKTKTTTAPWKGAEPYLLGAANTVGNVYQQNAGGIQNATNQVTGLMPDLINRFNQGDAGVNAARSYNVDVLGGKYLGEGNPYLQSIIDSTNNDTVNATQAALGLKGLTGGSSYADLISRNVGRNTANLRYGDYSAERDRMTNAAGQSPAISGAAYLPISAILGTLDASTTPLSAAGQYAGSLGGLFGGTGQTTQKDPLLKMIMQAAGNAAGAYAGGG